MSQGDYETEQQQLRHQNGYEDAGEELDDLDEASFEIPEVNPEIYRDVEPVLFQGFLTTTATLNGIPFVFKSLNHHEFGRLGMLYNAQGGSIEVQKYYSSFLAYGVLLADGINVLEDRNQHLPDLQDFFMGMGRETKRDVIRNMSEVNRRANKAIILTEAYTLEKTSRFRWAQTKGMDVMSPSITGFKGTESLGLNWGQLLWRAINYFDDQRENAEREWENAKFVASSMAGKEMQKIYSADKRRRDSEKEEKAERRTKLIRHALLDAPLDEAVSSSNLSVARTVGELSSQLKKDLQGEHDWHDRVIADHESKLRQGFDDRVEKVRKLREEHIQEHGDKAIVMGPTETGLTRADVEQRITRRRQQQAESMAQKAAHPELFDPKFADFANKWMNQQPIVQQPPSVMSPPDPDRPRSKPFRGGK